MLMQLSDTGTLQQAFRHLNSSGQVERVEVSESGEVSDKKVERCQILGGDQKVSERRIT